MGFEPTTTGITIRDSNQLSYAHHKNRTGQNTAHAEPAFLITLARPTGIEPVTPSLEGWCSIQLSYGQRLTSRAYNSASALALSGLESPRGQIRGGRGERIRTSDILLPKQARYRAALHPEIQSAALNPGSEWGAHFGDARLYLGEPAGSILA